MLACPVSVPSAFDTGVPGLAMVEIITAGVVEKLGGRAKDRILDRVRGRPNTYQLLVDNTNRLRGDDLSILPNVDHNPFAKPIRQPSQTIPLPMA